MYVTLSSATPNDDINHIIACISSERKTFLFWLFQLYEIFSRSPTRFIRLMCNTFFTNICCVHFLIRNFTFCWNLSRSLLPLDHDDDDDAQHAVWCFNWTLNSACQFPTLFILALSCTALRWRINQYVLNGNSIHFNYTFDWLRALAMWSVEKARMNFSSLIDCQWMFFNSQPTQLFKGHS